MDVFGYEESSGATADQMNITGANDRDAILLATSVILQGYRTEGELSELLANIVTDMREDGILNSEGIYQTLINQAVLLNLGNIRLNLEERYAALGMTVYIPNFENWVNTFIENSGFSPQNEIEYPVNTIYGDNILSESIDTLNSWEFYSLSAKLPAGNSLHIRLSGSSWAYIVMPDAPINWDADNYNDISNTQNFYSKEKGKNCMLKIEFFVDESNKESGETITIEYFENGSEVATKTRQIHVNFAPPL